MQNSDLIRKYFSFAFLLAQFPKNVLCVDKRTRHVDVSDGVYTENGTLSCAIGSIYIYIKSSYNYIHTS